MIIDFFMMKGFKLMGGNGGFLNIRLKFYLPGSCLLFFREGFDDGLEHIPGRFPGTLDGLLLFYRSDL
jgi:hypothetical protein